MTHDNSNPLGQEFGDPQLPTSARRRLIRGAFTAPVALTLCSGASAAVASNARCVANQVASPVFPSGGAASTYLIVPRYKVGTGPTTQYYVRGQDVIALAKPSLLPGGSYMNNSQWQIIAPIAAAPTNTDPGGSIDGANVVAVRVDVNGNIVGVVGGTAAAGANSAIAQTCWTSFKVG